MILAYIDPGSGSILIQVVLASFLGGIAVFWQKIKALLGIKPPTPPPMMICTTCGFTGHPMVQQNGTLIMFDSQPGMMKSPTLTKVCPKCGNNTMIPQDAPIAKKMAIDLQPFTDKNNPKPE